MEQSIEKVKQIMKTAIDRQASDIFIVAGRALTCKINGEMVTIGEERMMPDETSEVIRGIYELAGQRSMERLLETGDDDFSFSLPGLSRFRVSTYKQRGSLAAVIRVIAFQLPDPTELGIPDSIIRLADFNNGLVLLTG